VNSLTRSRRTSLVVRAEAVLSGGTVRSGGVALIGPNRPGGTRATPARPGWKGVRPLINWEERMAYELVCRRKCHGGQAVDQKREILGVV